MDQASQRWLIAALVLAGVLGWQFTAASAADNAVAGAAMPNPFYAYCVGIGTDAKSGTLQAQLELAPMLQELGYSGMGFVGLGGAMEMLQALEKHDQKLMGIYTDLNVDPGDRGYDPQLKELLPRLKGHGTVVWLTVSSRKYKRSSTDGDERAVELLREVAELARQSGVTISLYPHIGCYAERMEDVVRLASKAARPNVGVTFTFCHFLALDDAKNLDRVLEMARPYLTMVTINGTSGYDPKDFGRWIQVLGEGSFDVTPMLKTLRRLDYRGPIGIIAYGIKGDRREILSRSMQAWKRLSAQAAAEANPSPVGKIYELRIYKANPGKLGAMHARFRDHACRLFKKHGIEMVGFWTPTEGEEAKDTLYYILAFSSVEAQKKAWQAFRDDPEWKKAKADSEKDGVLVKQVITKNLKATDYSPVPGAGSTAKVYDMRTYKANPGKLEALNVRFRDYTCKIFHKHGMELIGFWTPTEGEEAKDTLIYIVAFPSVEAQKKAWDSFWADPEWKKIKADSEKDGVLVKEIKGKNLKATDYSPLGSAGPVDLPKRAQELKDLKWGMFVCWSFSTFSGKEWTPGVKDVAFFKATGCDTYPILPPHEGGAMWFYSLPKHDRLCHTAEKIYADYQGAVKHGNIFSLDVGPDYEGKLRKIDVETLQKVGRMIRGERP